jgi:TctA family transporter
MRSNFALVMGNLFGLLFEFIVLSCIGAIPAFVVLVIFEQDLLQLMGGTSQTVFLIIDCIIAFILFFMFMRREGHCFRQLSHHV